jgi:hypothetical protein
MSRWTVVPPRLTRQDWQAITAGIIAAMVLLAVLAVLLTVA